MWSIAYNKKFIMLNILRICFISKYSYFFVQNSDKSKMIPFIILWASLLLPIFFAHGYSCSFCSSWLKQTLSSQPTSLKGLEKGTV